MHGDGGQEEEENKEKMKPTALTDERSPVELFADLAAIHNNTLLNSEKEKRPWVKRSSEKKKTS